MNNYNLEKIKNGLDNFIKGEKAYRGEDGSYYYFLAGDDDIKVRKNDFTCFIKRYNQESWNYLFEISF